MNELKYPFLMSILPPEEGGGYLIEFPDLPGCMSDGETIEETIENGKDAVFCWIETAKEFGDEIPEPGSIDRLSFQRKSFSVTSVHAQNEYNDASS
ncbi:MAG: type II toxin-antitoxin system HicB family antitoxin [Candidatus Poribacteria bacterium]|nr:type II toxin-antitoxin system HicB family antitoxin [Candidatus Poribacteria bacterium]